MGKWTERNRWRKGRWLVTDDESGFVHYSDQVVRRWDGLYVRKDQDEPPDPQWYITAESDPKSVPFVRPDPPAGPACSTRSPYGPDGKLLSRFPGYDQLVGTGIGSFENSCSFVDYPDDGTFPK